MKPCKCGCGKLILPFDRYGRSRSYIHGHNNAGSNHWSWKGDSVGYFGVHDWIEKKQGKARDKKCSFCGSNKNVVWANISHEYKRDLTDWITLCTKCHFYYDKQNLRTRDYHGRLI